EMRGILNSGHSQRLAYVMRCDGESHEPRRFSTWAAMAFGLIGKLTPTLQDRSIEIPHKRRLKSEKVDRLRERHLAAIGASLRPKLARWAADNLAKLTTDPQLPEQLNDRAQDNWEPLLQIADLVGGDWPKLARQAAVALSHDEEDESSLLIRLLS